jgi:hypothetical protein
MSDLTRSESWVVPTIYGTSIITAHVVWDTYLGDEIFGEDRAVSVHEDIDSSVKRVQNSLLAFARPWVNLRPWEKGAPQPAGPEGVGSDI